MPTSSINAYQQAFIPQNNLKVMTAIVILFPQEKQRQWKQKH